MNADLSFVQQEGLGAHRTTLTCKERWTLSEGGNELKVQRPVSTQQGTGFITLVFQKGQGQF